MAVEERSLFNQVASEASEGARELFRKTLQVERFSDGKLPRVSVSDGAPFLGLPDYTGMHTLEMCHIASKLPLPKDLKKFEVRLCYYHDFGEAYLVRDTTVVDAARMGLRETKRYGEFIVVRDKLQPVELYLWLLFHDGKDVLEGEPMEHLPRRRAGLAILANVIDLVQARSEFDDVMAYWFDSGEFEQRYRLAQLTEYLNYGIDTAFKYLNRLSELSLDQDVNFCYRGLILKLFADTIHSWSFPKDQEGIPLAFRQRLQIAENYLQKHKDEADLFLNWEESDKHVVR